MDKLTSDFVWSKDEATSKKINKNKKKTLSLSYNLIGCTDV